MLLHDLKEIFIGCFRMNIGISILKYPDQTDQIIVTIKRRFYIIKVSDINLYIIPVLIPVSIDHAPLRRQIHTGYLPCLF